MWSAFERLCGRSWSRRFAAVVSIYTRPLVRVDARQHPAFNCFPIFVHERQQMTPRNPSRSVSTRLSFPEHSRLERCALECGLTVSEYLRRLVVADSRSSTDDRLLQTVEAEHTRLALLAAQQGKPLNQATLRELRSQAILNAPTLVEQTVRILKQQRNGGQ